MSGINGKGKLPVNYCRLHRSHFCKGVFLFQLFFAHFVVVVAAALFAATERLGVVSVRETA